MDLDKILADLLADRRSVKHAMAVLLAFPDKALALNAKELWEKVIAAGQGRSGTELCHSLPQQSQVELLMQPASQHGSWLSGRSHELHSIASVALYCHQLAVISSCVHKTLH